MLGGRFQKVAACAYVVVGNTCGLLIQKFGINSLGMTPQDICPEDFANPYDLSSGFGIMGGLSKAGANIFSDSLEE